MRTDGWVFLLRTLLLKERPWHTRDDTMPQSWRPVSNSITGVVRLAYFLGVMVFILHRVSTEVRIA